MGIGGSSRDLVIKVTLDSSGAVLGLQNLDQTLDATKSSAEQGEQSFNGLSGVFDDLVGSLGGLTGALAVAGAAATATVAAIQRGDEVGDVAQSFQSLTEAAGSMADVFLNELNEATGQTIDNFTLQKQAIEAVRTGAKPDEFVELTRAARALAEQTGGDTLSELQQLSQAFETGNVRALQNKLGIIDVKAAEEELARQLGVSIDQLTKEQEVQAARNAIIDASKQKTAELGDITNSAADNLATMSKHLQDAADKLALTIANSKELNLVIAALAKLIASIPFDKIINGLAATTDAAISLIPWIDQINVVLKLLADTSDDTEKKTSILTEGIKKAGDIFDNAQDSLKGWWEQLKKAAAELKKTGAAAGAAGTATGASARAAEEAKRKAEELNKKLEAQQKLFDRLTSADGVLEYRRKLEELASAYAENKVNLDEYNKSLTALRQAWIDGKGDAERFNDLAIDAQGEALEHLRTQLDDAKDDIANQSGEGGFLADLFGLDADTGQALGDALGDVVQTGFDVLNTLIQGGEIDTAQLISSLTTSIGQGIGSLFGAGELGGQIGSLVGTLINSIADAFGGDSAGTKARKAADKFFADAFDANRLSVLINGQLVQIADLVFGGNSPFAGAVNFGIAESGFFNVFNQLPQAAQNAFNGVGLAFAAFLGDIENLAGTLGAVFVNNIGGSLNNLQQLILATGVSVEDLEKALIDAALNGEISFVQAQGALDQLRQVMQQGIPDAVGAVVQAFQNLRNAGVTGGRFAVDALKDIAAEARELGLHTIPDVLSYLVSTGQQSAESVQILQNALAAFGITTLEQLQNLSNETAIAILANLQANNFPFEETQSQIDALREQLASIPQNIQRNLIFNVRVNGSQEDIDFVRHAQVTIPGQGPGPA